MIELYMTKFTMNQREIDSMNKDWIKKFDEQFRFTSVELSKDGNYDGTVLRNDLIGFISQALEQKYEQGQKEARAHYYEKVTNDAIKEEQERIIGALYKLQNEIPKAYLSERDAIDTYRLAISDAIGIIFPSDE